MPRNVDRQTVLALVAAVCFVLLAIVATSVFTVVLAAVSVSTLAAAIWRQHTSGPR
jgi:hypothetical protein